MRAVQNYNYHFQLAANFVYVHYGANFSATGLCLHLRRLLTLPRKSFFRFQTEFKTEVNLSIGLKPYFRV